MADRGQPVSGFYWSDYNNGALPTDQQQADFAAGLAAGWDPYAASHPDQALAARGYSGNTAADLSRQQLQVIWGSTPTYEKNETPITAGLVTATGTKIPIAPLTIALTPAPPPPAA